CDTHARDSRVYRLHNADLIQDYLISRHPDLHSLVHKYWLRSESHLHTALELKANVPDVNRPPIIYNEVQTPNSLRLKQTNQYLNSLFELSLHQFFDVLPVHRVQHVHHRSVYTQDQINYIFQFWYLPSEHCYG